MLIANDRGAAHPHDTPRSAAFTSCSINAFPWRVSLRGRRTGVNQRMQRRMRPRSSPRDLMSSSAPT